MKRVVVLGAKNLQQLSGVTDSLDAGAENIDVIAHPLNRISTQLPETAYGLIVEREAGETAFRALRRLARKPAAYDTAVVYWFDASDGFVRHRWNLRNILIARWIARSIIIVRGERWLRPSAGYVTKKVSGRLLNQITSDKTTLLFVALAALIVTVRALLAIPLFLRDVLASTTNALIGQDSPPALLAMCARVNNFVVPRLEQRTLSNYALYIPAALLSLMYALLIVPFCVAASLFRRDPLRLRVALISHEAQMNGAPQSLFTLLQGIDRVEFSPALIGAAEGRLTTAARKLDLPVIVVPMSQGLMQRPSAGRWLRSALGGMVAFPWLLLVLVNLRIRRVHVNSMVTPDAAFAARLLPGVKVIWHVRDTLWGGLWQRFQVTVVRVLANRVLCNSKQVQEQVVHYGVFAPRTKVIYNAVNEAAFAEADGQHFRASLHLSDDTVLIGCVGQITPDKGQDVLVRAALKVLETHPEIHVALVGTLHHEDFVASLRSLTASQWQHFTFTGVRTDAPDLFAAFDINVVPSTWPEPFGRVALEGMWLGVPTIASRTGGLPEIVGEAGVLVPSADVEALAEALAALVASPERRAEIGKAGYERARQHFSAFGQAQAVQQVYRYPDVADTRENHSRWWMRIRQALPGRVQAGPHLLLIYPALMLITAAWWAVTLPIFFLMLPFAMLLGAIARRTRTRAAVAVLCYQTNRNAGTRYRITKVFEGLSSQFDVRLFYPSGERLANAVYVSLFYGHQPHVRDAYYWLVVHTHRLWSLLRAHSFDKVVIQYALMREGRMWMERLLARTHPCTLYDFDDSLYAFERYARELPKFLPHVRAVIAGNPIIAEWARQFNRQVVVIPTCVEGQECAHEASEQLPLVLGWIGNPANLTYLPGLAGVLSRLAQEYPIRVRVVSAGPYEIAIPGLAIEFREWALWREQDDLRSFDIGLMPVLDDLVGRGKCGFKLLQYMAAGIPSVASPVGINAAIARDGENALLADDEAAWYEALRRLITTLELRRRIGAQGRASLIGSYTMDVAQARWAELLKEPG